jgi:hypothetical protein
MNKGRRITRHKMARHHRSAQYMKAINGVIDGRIDPGYASARWKKLKEVR